MYLPKVVEEVLLHAVRSCVSLPEEVYVFSYKLPIAFVSKIISNSDDVASLSSIASHFNTREDLAEVSISKSFSLFSISFSCMHNDKILHIYIYIQYIYVHIYFVIKIKKSTVSLSNSHVYHSIFSINDMDFLIQLIFVTIFNF